MDSSTNTNDHNSKQLKSMTKVAKRMEFSKFVDSKQIIPGTSSTADGKEEKHWKCCGEQFLHRNDIQKHVALRHKVEVDKNCTEVLKKCVNLPKDSQERNILSLLKQKGNNLSWEAGAAKENTADPEFQLPVQFKAEDVYCWLPNVEGRPTAGDSVEGRILLFYQYRQVKSTQHVCEWQKALCQRLGLTGKIRVATEGLNATVGGTVWASEVYIDCMLKHPLFECMTRLDFKCSEGSAASFPDGLKVGIYSEICPMGIDPAKCTPQDGGVHLSVDEFHTAAERYIEDAEEKERSVFVDCRNFYESDIGRFQGALAPAIRKFSYWPEYVDQNVDVFQNKHVYMYCTGGIRCERGSAYLKAKGICDGVYQLQGGIHKYIEKYPEGHFRGKMFVFDDRYFIKANEDILSKCAYCQTPHDQHRPCSSKHCHQLVLSCLECSNKGLTACCRKCQENVDRGQLREECDCTANRPRIPVENST